ncbi:hypothetical protein FXB39_10375 [Nocardioides sp. BGMRC 2183]|nr:hypothetical protein FXB39_10375 [Nocardioides sp. BGMRC 2183]
MVSAAADRSLEKLFQVVDLYYDRGWSLIPLRPGTKVPAMQGVTGGEGRYLSAREVKDELAGRGGGGLAIRLPRGVVGLDVDDYIKNGRRKEGGATLRALEAGEIGLTLTVGGEAVTVGGRAAPLGELPAAPRSSARAGDSVSGIRFFAIPEGSPEPSRDPGPDVELIRWSHRYAVVSPTRHPETGETYRWWGPDDNPSDGPPRVSDLPNLPAPWMGHLAAPTGSGTGALTGAGSGIAEGAAVEFARNWLDVPDAADAGLCAGVGVIIAAALAAARREGPTGVGREDLKGPVLKLAQAGEAGCLGARAGLVRARDAYVSLPDGADHETKFLHLLGTTLDRVQNPTDRLRVWRCSVHAPDHFDREAAPVTGTEPTAAPSARRPVNRQNDVQPLVFDVTDRDEDGAPKEPRKRVLEYRRGGAADTRPGLDVTNPGAFYDWLHANLGRGELSGVFRRHGGFVRVPRVGEEGWKPMSAVEGCDDGPAQVRAFEPTALADLLQRTFWVYKEREAVERDGAGTVVGIDYARTQATVNVGLLGEAVAGSVEWEGVPPVASVSHTPLVRADGSVLSAPGYDAGTAILYLPEAGFSPTRVPDEPVTTGQLDWARANIDYLLCDFPFESESHKASYIALLLTPLMREVVPPPYPMFIVNAHQRGSGKTLLARVAGALHGYVHRPALPSDDEELRKQFTSIMLGTTAPLVNFDNVEGVIRSKQLANLLTTATWSDRPLGRTASVDMRNDRIWLVTGNNVRVGGDLARRVQWVTVDPAEERPELRTEFREPDLEGYVRRQRDKLLVALLLIAKAWVERGMPVERVRSDGYARWAGVMKAVIEGAGWSGFEGVAESEDTVRSDDEVELGVLLDALRAAFGADEFLVKDVRARIEGAATPGEAASIADLDDAIPMFVKLSKDRWKSLGRYLQSHEKQYVDGLRAIVAKRGRDGISWRIDGRTR